MPEVTLRTQDCCYLSTPEHVRSFFGVFIYIYTDKGELRLTETHLHFHGKSGIPLDIGVDSITNVSVGHYSRISKPLRLDYVAVTHRIGESTRTVLFTPTVSWRTPVWKTNKVVAEWTQLLLDARDKRLQGVQA